MSILEPRTESQLAAPDARERPTTNAHAPSASDVDVAAVQRVDVDKRAPELRRIELLIGLLDDESTTVESTVSRELVRMAPRSTGALRRAAVSSNAKLRMRARGLLLELERERVTRRMIRFALAKELDLERGLLLLSRFHEPELDLRPTLATLDAWAAELLKRIESARPTASRAQILVEYLGRELGLRGDESDYHHPDNIYLHRALERRRGMPLTLTAIYVLVARRVGIRAAGVALPGHVVLRVHDAGKSALLDVFHGGRALSDRDCLKYLAEHGLPFHPRWFDDSTDATLWVRHVRNLQNSYRARGLTREVALLASVVAARERS